MRSAFVFTSVLVLSCASAFAGGSARWEERPFFPRRLHQQVPPPQYYATTTELPAGAEVKIKVVQCPDKARLDLHDFLGGPVFSRGIAKEFSDLAAGQMLTYKLDKKMKIGITSKVGNDSKEAGTCNGLEEKDGSDVMKFSFGNLGDLVVEVEVAGK